MIDFTYEIKYVKRKKICIQIVGSKVIVRCPRHCKLGNIEVLLSENKLKIKHMLSVQRKTCEFIKKIETERKIYFLGEIITLPKGETIDSFYLIRREILINRIKFLSTKFNLPINNLSFGKGKTAWGSCKGDNSIRLNERLVSLPEYLIDYVILHELAHTKIHNHSKNFWILLEKMDENYKFKRQKLKEYAFILSLYK